MNDTNAIEEQRMGGLQRARLAVETAKLIANAVSPEGKVKLALTFGKKISQHKVLLAGALFFDILGLIPTVGVVFNLIFGMILFLYFGPKRKKASSELLKIALPILGGSIIDFFLGIIPTNVAATLIRIALS